MITQLGVRQFQKVTRPPEILIMVLMLCASPVSSPSHRDHFCNVRDQKLDGRKALIGNEASYAPGKGSAGLHR